MLQRHERDQTAMACTRSSLASLRYAWQRVDEAVSGAGVSAVDLVVALAEPGLVLQRRDRDQPR